MSGLLSRLSGRRAGPTPAADTESGSISLFTAVSAVALISMVGLVIDGGGKVQALSRAETAAREGARAAAQAVRQDSTGAVSIDPRNADQQAQKYFEQAGVTGTVRVEGSQVIVDTVTQYHPLVVSLVGMGDMQVSGHASAQAALVVNGVEQ